MKRNIIFIKLKQQRRIFPAVKKVTSERRFNVTRFCSDGVSVIILFSSSLTRSQNKVAVVLKGFSVSPILHSTNPAYFVSISVTKKTFYNIGTNSISLLDMW